ncbi:bone morphogenetic protein 8A-like [Syngnathus scovelli]|uniref:bone morphogenetic protein 8A-like n=1 Tax=Syngnathus scovelli TaxID=161590 RepID=UPI00210FE3DD|nr:bone morphogenetic protein 8A-like [Syngnathus scovelli]
MAFTSVAVIALMCSSVMAAIVSQPKQEDALPQDFTRCHGESLQSIRKELLTALNLETEPLLPKGSRKQWNATAERLRRAVAAMPVSPGSFPDDGHDASGCCGETLEVSMTDLGWDNWMIYPEHVTWMHCAPCGYSASCRPQPNVLQRDDLQVQAPCCQPTAQKNVPVVYMDEWNTIVITSMPLTSRCGCLGIIQPPQE